MPRARTGNLELRKGIWHVRVTVERDGRTCRDRYTLDTSDRPTAERRKAKLLHDLDAGRPPEEASARAGAPDTVAAYAESIGERLSEGDRASLRIHVLPALGTMAVADVRPAHVKAVRDKVLASKPRRAIGTRDGRTAEGCVAGKVRRGTVGKALGAVRRLFAAALEDEIVEQNPASDVRLPKQRGDARETVKPRAILTDEEIVRYLACEAVDLELRMLSIVARCEGGMRTGDLHAWDWTHIDLEGFTFCTVPRSKTAAPEVLDMPEVLRPFLRAWWERAGSPVAGPVFPIRKGKRTGERKGPKTSHAKRLRRDLARAGVFRLPPVEVPATKPGTRTDLGRSVEGTKLDPNPRDPLYFETPVSLPADFHSFRRAFNTALAGANVNVQHAMHLAGHSDAKTHMRYVMQSPAMRAIPAAALPQLPPGPIRAKSGRAPANHRGSEGEDDEGEDDANSLKTSVSCLPRPSSKPRVRGSSPFGRARFLQDDRPGSGTQGRSPATPRRRGRAPSRPTPGRTIREGPMLRIHREQVEAFRQAAGRSFEDRMVEHLRSFAPQHCEALGVEAVRRFIGVGRGRAGAHGFTLCGPLRLYLELMLMLGSDFDTDPLFPWAGGVLCDPEMPGEVARASALHTRVRRYVRAVAGPRLVHAWRALEAVCASRAETAPPLGPGFDDAMIARLEATHPQKCRHAGGDALRALVERARGEARARSLDTDAGQAIFVVLAFTLGHGFASDPQYPWAAATLEAPAPSAPDARAARLWSRALLFLDQMLARRVEG
jgi:integrase